MNLQNQLMNLSHDLKDYIVTNNFLILFTSICIVLTIMSIIYILIFIGNEKKNKIVYRITLFLSIISTIYSLYTFYLNKKTVRERKLIRNVIEKIDKEKIKKFDSNELFIKEDGKYILKISLDDYNILSRKDGKINIIVDTNKIEKIYLKNFN